MFGLECQSDGGWRYGWSFRAEASDQLREGLLWSALGVACECECVLCSLGSGSFLKGHDWSRFEGVLPGLRSGSTAPGGLQVLLKALFRGRHQKTPGRLRWAGIRFLSRGEWDWGLLIAPDRSPGRLCKRWITPGFGGLTPRSWGRYRVRLFRFSLCFGQRVFQSESVRCRRGQTCDNFVRIQLDFYPYCK